MHMLFKHHIKAYINLTAMMAVIPPFPHALKTLSRFGTAALPRKSLQAGPQLRTGAVRSTQQVPMLTLPGLTSSSSTINR